MKVQVMCFGAMRDFLPEGSAGNVATLELPEDASVGTAIDALGAPQRLVTSILVNGTQASHDQKLDEGDEVTLMPPFTGG